MTYEEKITRALELINEFRELGAEVLHPALGMLIDTCAYLKGRDPVEFTEELLDLVKTVNDNMGMEGIA